MNVLYAALLAERSRWILWLPVGLGIGIGGYFALPEEPQTHGAYVSLSFAVLAYVGWRRFSLRMLAIIGFVIATGFAFAQWRAQSVDAPRLSKKQDAQWITGTVVEVQQRENSKRVILEELGIPSLADDNLPARVRINLMGKGGDPLLPGQRVEMRVKLMPIPPPAIPGGYDFGRAMYFQRIGAIGYTLADPVILNPADTTDSWQAPLQRLRQTVTARILASMDEPYGAIAAALMTGERGPMPEDVYADIRAAGLAHLLAISGLHIGLVTGILFFVVRWLLALNERLTLRYDIKKCAAVAALIGSFGYLLIAGMPISARRAWIMAAFVLVALLLDRTATPMRFLVWAATAILLIEPESLLSASFQLSFAATAALIGFYERFQHRFMMMHEYTPLRRLGAYILGIWLTSLVASFATAPFTLYHFGHANMYGLLANMAAIPLTTFWVLPAALVAFALMPLGLDGLALSVMEQGLYLMVLTAEQVAALPAAHLPLPRLPLWGLVLAALGGVWLCFWEQRWRYFGLAALMVGLLSPLCVRHPDILISKKALALHLPDDRLIFLRGSRRSFQSEVWRDALLEDTFYSRKDFDKTPHPALRCDPAGCILNQAGHTVALPLSYGALMDDCPSADWVVTHLRLPRRCGREGQISSWELYRNGPHAIMVGDAVSTRSARAIQGERPWTAGP